MPIAPKARRTMTRTAAPRAWQRMLSGRRLNLLDPSPLDIEIEDIAHGLARVARWNGQTIGSHIFSVAQHSLLVEAIAVSLTPQAGAKTRLAVLLHDAAEYVIGDMISPFKTVIGGAYRETENRILDAVMRRFGLPAPMTRIATDLAKRADRAAAYHEANEIFGAPVRLSTGVMALLEPVSVGEAERLFLERFATLDAAAQNPQSSTP
jgi:uncharacterized protein